MEYRALSDKAIAEELGSRVEQRRLEKNLSQQQLADEMGLSRVSYAKLEKGQCKLENLISALRALDALDSLDNFIPKRRFSPIALIEAQGKKRKRASKKRIGSAGSQSNVNKGEDEELDW
ncbi:hypothetical protein A9Q99_20905 [Gammaproteobacteria bacterium 45_16_T64]|nr:hypothetical protein A9Q99_20905 [Gammaproteobacteria bacterium 45_16_T64]